MQFSGNESRITGLREGNQKHRKSGISNIEGKFTLPTLTMQYSTIPHSQTEREEKENVLNSQVQKN
jgi:hypothetical protein